MADEVFNLHDIWRLSFDGIVPVTTWAERGPAEAQLELLRDGHSTLGQDGILRRRPRRGRERQQG